MPKVRRMASSRIPAAPNTRYVCDCPPNYGGPHVFAPEWEEVDMYLRISEDHRLGGIEMVAEERQRWETCRMCHSLRRRIARVWIDNDKSATSGVYRPGFEGTLLNDQTRVIATYHSDRYVRLLRELERVIDRDLTVLAVHAGTHDLSTPTGRATARTVTTWAQHEGELKSVRQKSRNMQAATNGEPRWWTRTPFGYNADASINAVQAAALKKVYENLLLGGKFSHQVKWLNSQGLYSNSGKPWKHGSLRHVVMAERNAGIRTYTTVKHKGTDREKREKVEIGRGEWEPIVSEETYRAVVQILSDPSRFTGGPRGKDPMYLLTAIAKCGVCGGGVHSNQAGEKKFRYYRCRESFCVHHRVEVADSQVIKRVVELLQDEGFQGAWREETFDAQPALIEKAQIKARLDEMAEDRMAGLITREQMLKANAAAEKRLAELDNLLVATGSSEPIAKLISDIDYVYQEFDLMLSGAGDVHNLDRARQIVMTVCQSITLMPRNRSRVPNPDHIVIVPRLPERQESVAA